MKPIIVGGVRYYIGSNTEPYKGFGGRKWTVRFNDGEVIKTDDLMLDYGKPGEPDTAVILEGWQDDAKVCGWRKIGEQFGFGKIEEVK